MIPPSTCQPWQTDRSGPMPESTVTTPSYTTPWDTIVRNGFLPFHEGATRWYQDASDVIMGD